MKMRVVAVIVLYKVAAKDSISYQSLVQAAAQVPGESLDLLIHLHDNTDPAMPPEDLPENVVYHADPQNTGLATAYNTALQAALASGYDWLLTLDQDTALPLELLLDFQKLTASLQPRLDVAAIVPQVRANGRLVSPHTFFAGAWPRWLPPGFIGTPDAPVYAFNSGSLLRVSVLRQIGGYWPWFWLDSSDLFLYRQIAKFGKRVYVAGNLEIKHDLSMLNMTKSVSSERYQTMLLAESAFWDLERNTLAGVERTLRLAARLIRQWLRSEDVELKQLTSRALFRRIFRSRDHRLQQWRSATLQRLGSNLLEAGHISPPKISVCMASYNGERFIDAQVRSIMPQLGADDEIVIVDDCSTDRTPHHIRRLQAECDENPSAPTIVFVQQPSNQGVVRTFEHAIRLGTGDIFFLCDNDDRWAPDKVRKVLEAFAAKPKARIVVSGITLIDEQDQPLDDPAYNYLKNRRFTTNVLGNLIRNHYQGSAMAFRSSLLRYILPLPVGKLFLHDAWMGLRNTLTGGETVHLREPLLLYRRHGANYSRRFPRWQQIRLRQQLVTTLISRAFQKL